MPDITEKSNTNSENIEERNSLRDNEYLTAVNNGDMQTAQRMVDEAAKEKGYSIKAYHGTKPYISEVQSFRYSSRYADIDLNTLEDNELQVYNNRGWSDGLFTDEERKLLQEKFNELNTKTRQRTDNVLGDGTRVVEINNKLVLIGGPFEDPIIHDVFVVNSENETETNFVKEFIYNESKDYRKNKDEYTEFLVYVQFDEGEEVVRNYNSDDFYYIRGRNTERATLPSNFKSYGYTKQFTERTGDNQETERNLSTDSQVGEKLYQARPTLDDFIFDDTDGEITDTDAFLMSQYITGDVRTISHIVNNTKNIDISDAKINQVVSRLVKSYDLSDSYNKDIKVAVIMLAFELVYIFNKQTAILSL